MGKDNGKHKTGKTEQFPLKWKNDFRVGSPQRVFRSVKDSVEDLGYAIAEMAGLDEMGSLRLKESPISDTATFKGEIRGERQLSSGRHKGYFVTGLVLAILGVVITGSAVAGENILVGIAGVVSLILGVVFAAISSRVSKAFLLTTIEGEAYKATAKMTKHAQEMDVVADVRLTIQARIGVFRGGTEVGETPQDADVETIRSDFEATCEKVEAVLPRFLARPSE